MDRELPFVDEHHVLVRASAENVWDALAGQFAGRHDAVFDAYLRLIAVEPRAVSGAWPEVGATVPGFRVAESVAGQRVVLTGRHRFSRYQLVFDLIARDGDTVVRASTFARFPGLHGAAYQALVIRSGAHRMVTRRMLEGIRHRAEQR